MYSTFINILKHTLARPAVFYSQRTNRTNNVRFYLFAVIFFFIANFFYCCDPAEKQPVKGDTAACAGTIIQPPAGLFAETDLEGFANIAVKTSGLGGLCKAKTFLVKKPVTVYRVWGGSSFWGRWWSLSYPEGTKEEYRQAQNICPEWNPLNRVIACTLVENALVVIGPGQSAGCRNTAYPKSPVNQVFVPIRDFISNCTESSVWPPG